MKDFKALIFQVGNAKVMASHFVVRYGFDLIAFKNLESCGNKFSSENMSASYAVSNGNVIFIFSSPLGLAHVEHNKPWRSDFVSKIIITGSPIRGFDMSSVNWMDRNIYGNVDLRFISDTAVLFDEKDGWETVLDKDVINSVLPKVELEAIDHVVGNQSDGQMMPVVKNLEDIGMHQYFSFDDTVIHTEYSALRSIVMASPNERVLLPINEPALGKKKSQIEEYIDYNGGPGVQHIALRTKNAISAVRALRQRGVKFLQVPKSYYTDLNERLFSTHIKLKEDIKDLEELGILVDFDDKGYLLQIFTEPLDARPLIFFEIIQRENCNGFGAGNFLALFKAYENEQSKRGNL